MPAISKRNTLAILSVVLCAGCTRGIEADLTATFEAAQQAFEEADRPEDFLKVAAMYQEIIDAGVTSGAVLYNQGNALMRAKQRGRAIAAYRQAQRSRPRDLDLDASLRYALGGEAPAAHRPVLETLLFWQDWLSYGEKFSAAAAAVVATFALGVSAVIRGGRVWKRLALAGVAVSCLLIFSAGYDWYRFDCIVHGVTVQPKVVARKGNALSYEPAFTEELGEGTEFRLVDRRGDWLLIRLAGSQEGWVPEDAAVLY